MSRICCKSLVFDFLIVITTILLSILIGFCLLLFAYLIPSDQINNNLNQSTNILSSEGYYPLLFGKDYLKLDNFTDSLMLSEVFEVSVPKDDSIFDEALHSYYIIDENNQFVYSDYGGARQYNEYTRYWHGYISFLRPLLFLFDYNFIRTFLIVFQLIIVCSILILLIKRQLVKFIIPFTIALISLTIPLTGFSMQYSSVVNIMLIACFVILLFRDKLINNRSFWLLFLISGILTAFFDLLTFPLVTFGIPCILLAIVLFHSNFENKIIIWKIVRVAIMWCVGYCAMWLGKLLLVYLVSGENSFVGAIYYSAYRTGIIDENFFVGFLHVLRNNLMFLIKNELLDIAVILFLLFFIVVKIINFNKIKISILYNRTELIILLILLILPIIWYAVLQNHSFEHSFMVYRNLSISLFAFSVILTEAILPNRE